MKTLTQRLHDDLLSSLLPKHQQLGLVALHTVSAPGNNVQPAPPPPPTVIEQVGDIQIVRAKCGDYGIQFETDDECLVTIWTYTPAAAVKLAQTLKHDMLSSFVDIGLDQVTA